jgi:hypothetical protein
LAKDARENVAITVWSGPSLPTPAQKEDRERRLEQLAQELDQLAVATSMGGVTYQHVDERLAALRALGKSPHNSLVSDVAKAFVALDALPSEPHRE